MNNKRESTEKVLAFLEEKNIPGHLAASFFEMKVKSYYHKISQIKLNKCNRYFSEAHYLLLLKSYKKHIRNQLNLIEKYINNDLNKIISLTERLKETTKIDCLDCERHFKSFLKKYSVSLKEASYLLNISYSSLRSGYLHITSDHLCAIVMILKNKLEMQIIEINKILNSDSK